MSNFGGDDIKQSSASMYAAFSVLLRLCLASRVSLETRLQGKVVSYHALRWFLVVQVPLRLAKGEPVVKPMVDAKRVTAIHSRIAIFANSERMWDSSLNESLLSPGMLVLALFKLLYSTSPDV